jgi:Fe2+ transport system protein B
LAPGVLQTGFMSRKAEELAVPALLLESLDALYRIARERPTATPAQLARRLGIDRTAATERILALQAGGLVRMQYGAGGHDLLHFMTRQQIFVYALLNTLYIPCVATIAVLARDLGWPRALTISGFTVFLALLAGGFAQRLLSV